MIEKIDLQENIHCHFDLYANSDELNTKKVPILLITELFSHFNKHVADRVFLHLTVGTARAFLLDPEAAAKSAAGLLAAVWQASSHTAPTWPHLSSAPLVVKAPTPAKTQQWLGGWPCRSDRWSGATSPLRSSTHPRRLPRLPARFTQWRIWGSLGAGSGGGGWGALCGVDLGGWSQW